MKRCPTKPLSELVDFIGGGTPSRDRADYWGGHIPWASVKDLRNTTLDQTIDTITEDGLANSASNLIPAGTVIVATRVGLGKVAINSIPLAINQDLKALRLKGSTLASRYLLLFLLSQTETLEMSGFGATVKGLTITEFGKLSIPVPPLAEQERIVKLLDEADELRKLRAQADSRTADLIPALFHEMFGDPVANSKRWLVAPVSDLLAEPLRNGFSPAKDGTYQAKVFTLSAISGEVFDPSAWKDALFARPPESNCLVSDNLFLICRGNGNRLLVGRAKFPRNVEHEIIFPDTMIAAVPNLDKLSAVYLEEAWNLPTTRIQILSGARTTNGTYKINQTVVEQLRLPLPPLSLQIEFAARVAEIRAMEAEQAASRRRLNDLFQSMLHRAFNGEL